MTGVAQAERESSSDSNIVLLLSLKLILLAFFILLNAISEFEEARTHQALESVTKTFRGQIEAIDAPALLDGSPGFLPAAEALINDVGSLFESLLPAMHSTRTARTRVVHIDLPSGAFFDIGKYSLRPDRHDLIRRLAKALLRRSTRDLVYHLEFLHGVPGDGATGARRNQEIRRASGIAALLVDEGMAPELLSIGVLPGKPGRVEFVLSVRDDTADPDAATSAGEGAL
jgi:hypothetical protein